MNNRLAIIIPAYKSNYLSNTLESLAMQTNKNFTIYIGDDASPYPIKDIVSQFKDKIRIVYHRFEENLGARSLVKQWERCVELSNEEWIWLFSDDDIASYTAVESFYKTLGNNIDSMFFKFFTEMIDAEGKEIKLFRDKTNLETYKISAKDYITKRLRNDRFRSYAIEYIFHRNLYDKHKFVEFPLAWSSDDSTWFLYAIENKGIDIILDKVFWRFSGVNISSTNDKIEEKKTASLKYINWLFELNMSKKFNIHNKDMLIWLINQISPVNIEEWDSIKPQLNGMFSEYDLKEAWDFHKKNRRNEKIKMIIKTWFEKTKLR